MKPSLWKIGLLSIASAAFVTGCGGTGSTSDTNASDTAATAPTFTAVKTIDVEGGTFGIPVYDGTHLVVSHEYDAGIRATKYDKDTLAQIGTDTTLFSDDLIPETHIADHKHLFLNGYHYLALSAGSGNGTDDAESLYVVKVDTNLSRVDFKQLVDENAAEEHDRGITHDMWMTTDGTSIYIGIYRNKDIYKCGSDLDTCTLYKTLMAPGIEAHGNGAAALYRDGHFYLVAPDMLGYHNEHIGRFIFDKEWEIEKDKQIIVEDNTDYLGISSGLSWHEESNTWIVHFNRGDAGTSTGLYRAVYDTDWNLLDESTAVEGNWIRPHSLILGDTLYLGYDKSNGIKLTKFEITTP